MKIAIVAPSSVPFVIGGAENLWWGLQSHINQATSHHAELTQGPTPDGNFWEVLEGYRRFSELDVSHFDLVISTKHPAWMVQHPNHTCYMQHRLRGLYDTYWMNGLPLKFETTHPPTARLSELMRLHRGDRAVLPEWFARMERLRASGDAPAEAVAFPGPFARQCVHFLDNIALSTRHIRRYCAISKTVSMRKDYFPPGVRVDTVYHPSNLQEFRSGPGEFLFTASRLDGPKRIDLLIRAMAQVQAPVELRIAGTGPCEQQLRELAADDSRIRFLGYVTNAQLIEQYAGALAVPFVPYDEDLGLITLEAMRSGKPVLTTHDSGGPNEFVRNNETGFSVAPDPAALAERIDFMWDHRAQCRLMGLNGHRLAEQVTWDRTISGLLAEGGRPTQSIESRRRRKMVVAVPFSVYPAIGGGQQRMFHLYRHLARRFDIELLTIASGDDASSNTEIAPGLREIRVARSPAHRTAEADLAREVEWVPISDVALPQLHQLTPDYAQALRRATASADCVIASHPYLLPAIESVWHGPTWYEAHNVESLLKENIIPDTPTGQQLLDAVFNIEQACCDRSALIITCSEEDRDTLSRLYRADQNKIIVIPNGVNLASPGEGHAQGRVERRLLQKPEVFTSVFIGSWHGPNLDAVRAIMEFAAALPELRFIVIGSACAAFESTAIPPNVALRGVVDDSTKLDLLASVDLALNPIVSGSGTNLKVLDYCAAGVPVLSTHFGVRGLGLRDGVHVQLANIEEFPAVLDRAARSEASDPARRLRVAAARHHVCTHFEWEGIAQRTFNLLAEHGAAPFATSKRRSL